MNTKIIKTTAIVTIMLAICLAPVLAEESDAMESKRVSDNYIVHARYEKTMQMDYVNIYAEFYFIENSANHTAMLKYLSDPLNNNIPTADESNQLISAPLETVFHIYDATSWWSDDYSININGYQCPAEKVLDPYGTLSFFVKAGDTLRITVNSCIASNGDSEPTPVVDISSGSENIDPTFVHKYNISTEVKVGFNNAWDAFYIDTVYDVTGNSSPNGSATVYIAVCALITVLVLGILVFASIKPKWSK